MIAADAVLDALAATTPSTADRLEREALRRAVERMPPPPPGSTAEEWARWRETGRAYAAALLAGWATTDHDLTVPAPPTLDDDTVPTGDTRDTALRVVDVRELLALSVPAREPVLAPILFEKQTAMVHAWRGVGKTHVGLGLAFAIASGGSFLRWWAPQPRRVLYLDGEMPLTALQARLATIVDASEKADDFDPANLRLVCADLQDGPMPNLSTPDGQAAVEPLADAADVVLVDSISTLASAGRENEAESWLPMQAWALDLRRRGKTVVLLHHDGKGGQQRGTSRREDILDLVIHLRRPADYTPSEGCRFEAHFAKARGLHGADVAAFEAKLEVVDGRATWTMRSLEDAQIERARQLYADGCSPADVMVEMGCSRATAYRLKKQLAESVSPSQPLGVRQ